MASPMRSPVKLPGPRPTTRPCTSSSVSRTPASRSSTAPGRRSLIFEGGPCRADASGAGSPGRPTASESVRVELSRARIIPGPVLCALRPADARGRLSSARPGPSAGAVTGAWIEPHAGDARAHHPQRPRRRLGHVEDAAGGVRAAVVHPDLHHPPVLEVGHPETGAERQGPMRGGERCPDEAPRRSPSCGRRGPGRTRTPRPPRASGPVGRSARTRPRAAGGRPPTARQHVPGERPGRSSRSGQAPEGRLSASGRSRRPGP